MKTVFIAVLMVLLVGGGVSAQTVVYSNNFESGVLGPEWSGAGSIQSSQGLSAFGFGNLHLKNDGATANILTLSSLDPHTTMTLSFSLAMWDSIDFGGASGDLFQVQVNGAFVINEGFGNYFPATGSAGPGTQITPNTNGNFDNPQFGYSTTFRDSARDVLLTFEHTASNAIITFQFPNTQGAPDEAFGIDNLIVSTNAVPEPATLVMLASGAVGLGVVLQRRRRRRKAKSGAKAKTTAQDPLAATGADPVGT